MKRSFIILLSFLSVCFIACKENTTDGMYEDKIGFLNSGEQLIGAYIANTEIEFESPVYKSGIGTGQANVVASLDEATLDEYNLAKETDYEMMPADCYTITNSDFVLNKDNKNGVVKIKIDVKKLQALQGVMNQKYVVALKLAVNGDIALNSSKSTMILIPEITGGIRPNSAKVLWNKTFLDMGIPNDNNAGSFAVTSQYVFVNGRSADLKYFDRFTGAYVGSVVLPFKGNLTNFTITADSKDNLLITNLRNSATGNALQTIYRIKGTSAPVKYIDLSHAYPNGRKLSVTGDLDQDAIITATVENSSRVIYWLVKNGVLVSQTPQVYTADATRITWATFADAVALGTDLEKGMFIVGNGTRSNLGFFSKNGDSNAEYDLLGGGLDPASFRSQSLSYATFNGASYLAVAAQKTNTEMLAVLFDVTKTSNLKLDPNSQKLIAYRSPSMTTLNNGNFTADVHLKVSDDLNTMVLYGLGTNGSVYAVQFDNDVP
ncbi:DUF5018 domain-containing protein [Pedobacter sp. ASV1-7]|uniref:DUF5018 domain-containing protein n=1 Tax=Pedobacter sp. ASV1-7 TaxID=3145237 RepID=UPI0032E8B594